jgi:hypothetical protein
MTAYRRAVFLVTDLRHFDGVELDPAAPGPALRLAEYLRRIVRAATASPVPGPQSTALACRRRPGHRPCTGHLLVERQDVPSVIRWECPACGEEGVIDGWQASPYDLSAPVEPEESDQMVRVVLPERGYRLILEELHLDPECERLVYRARPVEGGVELSASEEDFEELAGAIAFEANHATTRERQRRLDGLAARLGPEVPGSLEGSADIVLEEFEKLGLVASRAHVTELLHHRVAMVATALGISEESAGRYLDEESLREIARGAAVQLADEQPGADLLSQQRTIPIPLDVLGRSIAALAEAAHVRELKADNVGVHGALQAISLLGQLLHEHPAAASAPIRVPQAALARGARLLEATARMIREGAALSPDIPVDAAPSLTEAFARDARMLRALVREYGTPSAASPDS